MDKSSEKYIEAKLVEAVRKAGGMCIKLTSCIGLPDRLCLMRDGHLVFIELKSTGIKPRKSQLIMHNKIRKLGFAVLVIDNMDKLNNFINVLNNL